MTELSNMILTRDKIKSAAIWNNKHKIKLGKYQEIQELQIKTIEPKLAPVTVRPMTQYLLDLESEHVGDMRIDSDKAELHIQFKFIYHPHRKRKLKVFESIISTGSFKMKINTKDGSELSFYNLRFSKGRGSGDTIAHAIVLNYEFKIIPKFRKGFNEFYVVRK